jgi:EAL domain-containing protein (putative c-di-GMP-specific phosphodiesterase class I)
MNAIKIDREFVRGLPLDAENAAITSSIVGLAHSLAFEVVAEGVETEAEEEFLRQLQCDVVQGFLHARPMSSNDLVTWHAAAFGNAPPARLAQ